MSEIKIDTSGIKKKVNEPLGNAYNDLESARSILSSIKIPSDFYYRDTMSNLPSNIQNQRTRVNTIKSWTEEVVSKFDSVETKNSSLMDNLLEKDLNNSGEELTKKSDQDEMAEYLKNLLNIAKDFTKKTAASFGSVKLAFLEGKGEAIEKITDDILLATTATINTAYSVISYVFSDNKEEYEKKELEICEKVNAFVAKDVVETSFDYFYESKAGKWLDDNSFEDFKQGGKVTTSVEELSYDLICNPDEIAKRVGASAATTMISLGEGLYEFLESMVDFVALAGTAAGSIGTGVYDGITYLMSDNREEWESTTSKVWKGTMGFVAEEHVKNVFSSFYEDTSVGQWLNDNAYEAFKPGGVISSITEGLGYVSGIIITSILTGGATGIASTAVTTATAGASALGKYTEEYWADSRDSSWQGMIEKYKKGQISDEDFEYMQSVRNMGDSEWNSIESLYSSGEITEEQYQMLKQIREMPEEWKTSENAVKGLAYGGLNAGWEMLQWYSGMKLAGITPTSSSIVNSIIRVGADTTFNAADTPFRTLIDSLTSDKTLKEAWKNQGGWKSLVTNIGIGLFGSVGGEVTDGIRMTKNGNKSIMNNVALEKADGIRIAPDATMEADISKQIGDFMGASGSNTGSVQTINEALEVTLKQQGLDVTPENIDRLLKRINKGDYSCITKDYGARDLVRLEVENEASIRRKLNSVESLRQLDKIDSKMATKLRRELFTDLKDGSISMDSISKKSQTLLLKEFNERYPDTFVNGARKLETATQIAEYFNDPRGFLASKFASGHKPLDDAALYGHYSQLSVEDKNIFATLLANQRVFSKEEQQLIDSFSKYTGPAYAAYVRQEDIKFDKILFKGKDGIAVYPNGKVITLEDYISGAEKEIFGTDGRITADIDMANDVAMLDNIINGYTLEENFIVRRNVNNIYKNGKKISTFDIGTTFNDSGYMSTSADIGKAFDEKSIKLEIEIPAGTNIGYIEQIAGGRNNYSQQEILLGRNNTYEISDFMSLVDPTGQTSYQAILPVKMLSKE